MTRRYTCNDGEYRLTEQFEPMGKTYTGEFVRDIYLTPADKRLPDVSICRIWKLEFADIVFDAICNIKRQQSVAAVAAGSVKSDAKTAAARENAKRPRPNAQGKPKPRKPKTE